MRRFLFLVFTMLLHTKVYAQYTRANVHIQEKGTGRSLQKVKIQSENFETITSDKEGNASFEVPSSDEGECSFYSWNSRDSKIEKEIIELIKP